VWKLAVVEKKVHVTPFYLVVFDLMNENLLSAAEVYVALFVDVLLLDVLIVFVLVVAAAGKLVACGTVVHVLVEDGLVGDELVVWEWVGHLLAVTECEKIVCRWAGCEQAVM